MNKELVFLKGFAKGRKYWKLMKAIDLALKLHDGQTRKSGEPYIEHPTRVASSLVNLGIEDEDILCVAILHDVIEDCNVSKSDLESEYNMGHTVSLAVSYLSKQKDTDVSRYYELISHVQIASLVKISDRCHNISTMVGAFTEEKMKKYVDETENYVLPLCKKVINSCPEHSDKILVMKYHIESVLNCVKEFLKMVDKN